MKRHVLVDTQGLLLHGIVTASRRSGSKDGGLALIGDLVRSVSISREIVRRNSAEQGSVFHRSPGRASCPIARPEIVKRSDRVTMLRRPAASLAWSTSNIAWLNRCRLTGQGLGEPAIASALGCRCELASFFRRMLRTLCTPTIKSPHGLVGHGLRCAWTTFSRHR